MNKSRQLTKTLLCHADGVLRGKGCNLGKVKNWQKFNLDFYQSIYQENRAGWERQPLNYLGMKERTYKFKGEAVSMD